MLHRDADEGAGHEPGGDGQPTDNAVVALTANIARVSATSPATTTGSAPKRSVSRPPRVLPPTEATPNTSSATLTMAPW